MNTYEVEESIIGALLIDSSLVGKVCDTLQPEMFTSSVLGRIYLEYLRAYDIGKRPTFAEIQQNCIGDNYSESEVSDALMRAATNTVISTEINGSAEVLAKEYRLRQAEITIRNMALEGSQIDDQLADLIGQLERIVERKKIDTFTLAEIAEANKGQYFTKDKKRQLFTGTQIDNQTGGLEGGDVIILAARPAVGKSVFAGQMALNWAKQGLRVGYYNLEMQPEQLYERWLASESGIKMGTIRKATSATEDVWRRFNVANEVFAQVGVNLVVTSGTKTVSEIRREIRHMNYDVLVIDYMQLLEPEGTYQGNRAAEVADISRGIKAIAMENKIPVIALSQLNRASELKKSKEPTMAELRESGAIEQDASIVILMWKEGDSDERQFNVAKCRQGVPGKCSMTFDGSHARFIDDDNPFKEGKNDN